MYVVPTPVGVLSETGGKADRQRLVVSRKSFFDESLLRKSGSYNFPRRNSFTDHT